MKKLIFCLLAFCFFTSALAQSSIDLFSVTGRFGLPAEYRNYPNIEGTETGLMANLKLPIRFKNEKYIWYNELTYSNFMVSGDTTFAQEKYHPMDLHGFIIQTGLVMKLSESSALQVLFAPRYMTDFKGSNNKWQFGVLAMFEKRYKETLMLRFGAIIHQDLFGPNITPVVHTDWQIGDRWSIVGMWPVFGKVNYHISENTTAGFSHFGLTTTYRLSSDYNSDYIERNSIDLSLFLRQRVFGNFHLEGRFGYSINRNYAQFAENDKLGMRILIFSINDNREVLHDNISNGLLGSIGLVYNLKLEGK